MTKTVEAAFFEFKDAARASATTGMRAVYQFLLSGDGGGSWHLRIEDGSIHVGEGELNSPDIVLRVQARDWIAIASGTMNLQTALTTGRLRLEGDVSLAIKLQALMGRADDEVDGREGERA